MSLAEYVADTDVVDVDDWTHEEPTRPGVRTTAELVAEADALALVRQWLDEQERNEEEETP